MWSARIANRIAGLHERNVYDLLAATPAGAVGIVWDSMTTAVHRDNLFERRTQLHTTALVLLIVGLFVAAIFIVSSNGPFRLGNVLSFYLLLILAAAVTYVDFAQSIVLSGLAGVVGGALIQRPYDAGMLGALAFGALQCAVYGLAAAATLVFVQALGGVFTFGDMALEIVAVLIAGVCILALREAAVVTLWRWILRRVETGPIDAA